MDGQTVEDRLYQDIPMRDDSQQFFGGTGLDLEAVTEMVGGYDIDVYKRQEESGSHFDREGTAGSGDLNNQQNHTDRFTDIPERNRNRINNIYIHDT